MKPTIILAGPAVNVNEKTSGNMSVRDIVKKSSLMNVRVISSFTSKASFDSRVGFSPMEFESQIYSLQHEKEESMGRLLILMKSSALPQFFRQLCVDCRA